MSDVPAHDQRQTLRLIWHFPDHEPREGDPHYAAFEAVRRRMKAAGLLTCKVPGCRTGAPVQLHHTHIEFALLNAVDVGKLNEFLGLHLTDAEFQEWAESPGNLEALCQVHHTGRE